MKFEDIIGKKDTEKKDKYKKLGVYVKEIDLSKSIPLHNHLTEMMSHKHGYNTVADGNVYYNNINLGTPKEIKEMVDMSIKVLQKFKKNEEDLKNYSKQIDTLANFFMKNYSEKICGSAVETAINILTDVKSIEYNNGSKEIYENGVIVGANGVK